MKLKSGDLNTALGLKMLRSKTKPLASHVVNKACNSISYKAWKAMPRVSPAQIDAELNASPAQELRLLTGTKKARMAMLDGNPMISKNKKNIGYFFGALAQGFGYAGQMGRGTGYGYRGQGHRYGSSGALTTVRNPANDGVPLAALIIQAQVNPDSNFNRITGGVFARAASPFKGKSRAAGAQAMLDAMRRMLSRRHSSAGFFASVARAVNVGFGIALGRIQGIKMPPLEGQKSSGDVNRSAMLLAKGLAEVYPASPDALSARASFRVSTTEADTKGVGNAMERIIEPVWQRAVDDEAAATQAYADSLYTQAARDSGITVR